MDNNNLSKIVYLNETFYLYNIVSRQLGKVESPQFASL